MAMYLVCVGYEGTTAPVKFCSAPRLAPADLILQWNVLGCHRHFWNDSSAVTVVSMRRKETAMETDTLMVEQLEAIIHRLTQRIADAGQLPHKRSRLTKQSLFRMKPLPNTQIDPA
jgi:hypothetical protein